ncbi:hypothetical protein CC79DRAFT_1319084 [Sarocladium strictum]
MRTSLISTVALLALGQHAHAFKVSLIADHNRDGNADCKDLKVADRCSSDGSEALFLPAVTDTDKRCSKKITPDTKSEDLDKCHDGTDNVLRHPKRLAPLMTKPIKRLSDDATGKITVTCDTKKWKDCEDKVRIFQEVDGSWKYINPANHTFSAKQLKAGLKLGVDGRDVRRPGVWDGRVQLNFKVKDSKRGKEASDCVAMRVSPLLTHSHVQDALEVFSFGDTMNYTIYEQTKKNIAEAVEAAGFDKPINYLGNYPDLWVQDLMEPAYTSIPGPEGEAISIRIIIRSSVVWNDAGRAVFEELRDGDVGAVQDFQTEADDSNIDATGNLETVPPYSLGDKHYPSGRVVMGMRKDDKPAVLNLINSQEEQPPIILDSEWVEIGHVDEYFQFLPADSERGWVLMAADPAMGIKMLQKAEKAGHGDVIANSRYDKPLVDEYGCMPNHTISQVLNMTLMLETNEYADDRITYNIGIIKNETGLTDEEILRIPSIYYTDAWQCDGFGDPIEDDPEDEDGEGEDENESENVKRNAKLTRRHPSQIRRRGRKHDSTTQLNKRAEDPEIAPRPPGMGYGLSSFYPATINGLVLPGNVVTANPWGPAIDGVDIFAEVVEDTYGSIGMNVTFLDDWESLRLGGGGVHCATNSWRDFGDAKWW